MLSLPVSPSPAHPVLGAMLSGEAGAPGRPAPGRGAGLDSGAQPGPEPTAAQEGEGWVGAG